MADKKLEVYLDITANPPVIVDRDVSGKKKNKIVWELGDGEDFDFHRLSYWTDGGLSNPKIENNKKKLTADHDESKKGAHEYVLIVKKNGVEYDTTISNGPPTGDKPVIRN